MLLPTCFRVFEKDRISFLMEGECVRRSGEGVRAWFACHHPWYARAPATSCSFSGHISIRYTHTHTHTTTTMVMNTVFSKAFFFLLLVVGGSVNLASYGGLSSSLRLGPVGALASKAPKDMPLSDLPEEFWFNDVSGEFMHARHATSSTYCSPRRSPSAP